MKILRYLLILILLAAIAALGYFFLPDLIDKEENRAPIDFVPMDYAWLIESDEPINDWQSLSKSSVWKRLKQDSYFDEIGSNANYLDSLLNHNKLIVKLIKLGNLLISAHLTSSKGYENLILVDLKGLSKASRLGTGITAILESTDYEVATSELFGNKVWKLKDPATGEVLSMSRISNVLIVSYDYNLLKKSVLQSEEKGLGADENFLDSQAAISRDEGYSLYINYKVMDRFLGLYTDSAPEMMMNLEKILAYSAFDFKMNDDEIELNGYTRQVDSVASFFNVFKDIGKGRVLCDEVLPMQTAFFSSISFDDFADFYDRFERVYQQSDPKGLEDFNKTKSKTEKFFKIDFKRDIFSWMTDEVVAATIPQGEGSKKFSHYALLHFDDYDKAKERLDYIGEQIRKNSPVKFEEQTYRGFPIRYLKLKGFFKLFFKKLFSKIETPHYTLLDDYVVFSNDATSLEYMTDQYLSQNTLEYDEDYENFRRNFESRSNIFAYIHSENFYPYLHSSLDYASKVELHKHKEMMLSFPRIGIQLYPKKGMYKTFVYSEFEGK